MKLTKAFRMSALIGIIAGLIGAQNPGATPITGAPYSASVSNERTQTLADGSRIVTMDPSQTIYRDSQGRTRLERRVGPGPAEGGEAPPMLIEIVDPVAGLAYSLDSVNQIAHRSEFAVMAGGAPEAPVLDRMANVKTKWFEPAPPGIGDMPSTSPAIVRRDFVVEELGFETIEGVQAVGRRTIKALAGSAGNGPPITVTHEFWMCPDLRLLVLSKDSDPRGDRTMRLTHISTVEPDPALFQIPPGYTVVEVERLGEVMGH